MASLTGQTYSVVTNPATLTLAPGFSFQAPMLVPTATGDESIDMSNATYYLLGNSSSSSITLDGSQFPAVSAVLIWNGSGYDSVRGQFRRQDGPGRWPPRANAPGVAVNQGFCVLPSAAFTYTFHGVTGSPTNYIYSLLYATISDGTTTTFLADAISTNPNATYSG